MMNLSVLEFDDLVTVYDVVLAVQRNEMVMRIVNEIQKYIYELGNEGRLISMQLEDLVDEVEKDGIMLVKDYSYQRDYNEILKLIKSIPSDELLELSSVCKIFGYNADLMLDTMISPKGYRLMSKIPKVPPIVIDNLVKTFGQLKNVMRASIEELDNVEGIGEARARTIKEGLRKLQEKVLLNRHI